MVERFQQRTGRRAEQKLLQPALPVGAHDQKVRVGVGCRLENPVGDGVAFASLSVWGRPSGRARNRRPPRGPARPPWRRPARRRGGACTRASPRTRPRSRARGWRDPSRRRRPPGAPARRARGDRRVRDAATTATLHGRADRMRAEFGVFAAAAHDHEVHRARPLHDDLGDGPISREVSIGRPLSCARCANRRGACRPVPGGCGSRPPGAREGMSPHIDPIVCRTGPSMSRTSTTWSATMVESKIEESWIA